MKKLMAGIAVFCMMLAVTVTGYCSDTVNISVLCYHDVSNNPFKWSQYVISEQEMEDDFRYFTENGYTFLKPSDMWYADSNEKNIVFTFDDGYEGIYKYVFPLMKEYNVKCAVYIIGSEINKTHYLKDWQIKEMDESGLMEIGNHTNIMHTYDNSVSAYKSDPVLVNDFMEDVKDCSSKVYGICGHGTESIAYPSGRYTAQMDNILRQNLGYTTTFSTEYGMVNYRSEITQAMKRMYRNHGDTPEEMEAKIFKLRK